MNCNQCHAAKDFVRTVQLSVDDLIYAESMVSAGTKDRACIFERYMSEIMPVLRLGAFLSGNILNYSSYEPILKLAGGVENNLEESISELHRAKKQCGRFRSSAEDMEHSALTSKRVCERLTDDMRMTEISERLGCDYLRYMICLLEGAVRLSENALSYEMCDAAVEPVRAVSKNCRELLHDMKRLLAVTE